jgi:hypothetical protein
MTVRLEIYTFAGVTALTWSISAVAYQPLDTLWPSEQNMTMAANTWTGGAGAGSREASAR